MTNVELVKLVTDVYDELKQIARARMAQEAVGHTLQATALVGEAYGNLSRNETVEYTT